MKKSDNLDKFEGILNFNELYLPTPKVHGEDRKGIHSWSKFYSAFSESFARKGLLSFRKGKNDIVLDPFLGSGTSAVASAKCGNPFVGVDLDPFSVILSRTKVVNKVDICKIERVLNPPLINKSSRHFCNEAHAIFSLGDLSYGESVYNAISSEIKPSKRPLLESLLNDDKRNNDSLIVALASLLIVSNDAANIYRGSNPVWKRINKEPICESKTVLKKAALERARCIAHDLDIEREHLINRESRFLITDAKNIPIEDKSIDFVLTSPPYLNRLDYIVDHLAALAMLSGFKEIGIEDLRRRMIGTTKIQIKTGSPHGQWGTLCLNLLKNIKNHPSKASESYYYWTYFQYFMDIYEIMKELTRKCKKGAVGLFVLQNSYYKELNIPTAEILCEMADNLNVSGKIIRNENVNNYMGTLSPSQRKNAPQKKLNEKVIKLTFQ